MLFNLRNLIVIFVVVVFSLGWSFFDGRSAPHRFMKSYATRHAIMLAAVLWAPILIGLVVTFLMMMFRLIHIPPK